MLEISDCGIRRHDDWGPVVLPLPPLASQHPSHFHFEETIKIAKKLSAKKTILTNLHVDLDYQSLKKNLPKNIVPAYDGMSFNF